MGSSGSKGWRGVDGLMVSHKFNFFLKYIHIHISREEPLEKEMTTHSSILAQEIPWTEEPGGLQSKGSQRVRHD